ncbi:MAG: hypothetical protein KDA93_13895 [Planctomycetaceae bacterium]|nr:hypothetical protein [Planctomycetaceae bacterium]
MSTALTPPDSQAPSDVESAEGADATATEQGPDLNVLEDRVPEWLQGSRVLAMWTAIIGLLYLVLSYQPLWHTDIWGHLSYGRWIWEHGRLPDVEPLMPLSIGITYVDTAWLSQLIGYGLCRQFGVAALQMLYAASITFTCVLLLSGVLRKSQRWIGAGVIALLTFAIVDYQQLLIVRPQLFGLVAFVGLFTLLTTSRWRTAWWFVVPAIFVLWANLHGSFIVGLGLLAVMCAGHAIDVFLRTRNWKAITASRTVRRLFVLTEVSAVAVLLNPYGIGLYGEVFAVAGNANVHDLIEWDPLTLRMSQGKAAALCALAVMFVYRLSPRRVRSNEVLLLVGLGVAAMWSSRMILWWAPVAAYFLAIHSAATFRRKPETAPEPSPRSGKWSVVTIGLAWIFFAYTPFGLTLLHGQPKSPEERARKFAKSTSMQTPIALTGYLHRHPPQGLVLNTYEWGDYLLWAGPKDMQVFVNSHAHLVPEEVWQDYLAMVRLSGDWEDKLDRYGVNAIVLEKSDREALVKALREQEETWQVGYEDNLSIAFTRKTPI